MILFNSKHGTLEYDPSIPAIVATFNGYMSPTQFKDFMNLGLDYLIQKSENHPQILWLADTRKHLVQPLESTHWVSTVWNDRALQGGLQHVAFVQPENPFGAISVKSYTENTKKNKKDQIEVAIFSELDKAKNWFRELQKKGVNI